MKKTKAMREVDSRRRIDMLYIDICELCDKHMAVKGRFEGPIVKSEVRVVLSKLLHDEMQKDVIVK